MRFVELAEVENMRTFEERGIEPQYSRSHRNNVNFIPSLNYAENVGIIFVIPMPVDLKLWKQHHCLI